jgi:hypothetical protein
MENKKLTILILKSLEEMYLNSNDLLTKLKMKSEIFEQKSLFMQLSSLLLNNFILSNWIPDRNGHLVKYYYLSRYGLKYIQQNN